MVFAEQQRCDILLKAAMKNMFAEYILDARPPARWPYRAIRRARRRDVGTRPLQLRDCVASALGTSALQIMLAFWKNALQQKDVVTNHQPKTVNIQ